MIPQDLQRSSAASAAESQPERGRAVYPDRHSPTPGDHRVRLMGVDLDVVTEAGAVDRVVREAEAGRGGQVVTVNLDILRRCVKDEAFRAQVDKAELVVADGMPLVWACRVQGTPLPERVAGSSMVSSLGKRLGERGLTLFLLGGEPGAAEGAAKKLHADTPGLRVVGTHCPPVGFEEDEAAWEAVKRSVLEADGGRGPDVVYVALGCPKQERVIERLRRELPEQLTRRAWWLGVGISLGFLSGQVKRAPTWMQKCGLEWAHRLMQEPRRLMRRYFVDGPPFALRLFGSAVCRAIKGRRKPTGGS
ncbi:MAG: WecB/TagA/CpsF family glycosyltransferase [Planctomycetota bacterium]